MSQAAHHRPGRRRRAGGPRPDQALRRIGPAGPAIEGKAKELPILGMAQDQGGHAAGGEAEFVQIGGERADAFDLETPGRDGCAGGPEEGQEIAADAAIDMAPEPVLAGDRRDGGNRIDETMGPAGRGAHDGDGVGGHLGGHGRDIGAPVGALGSLMASSPRRAAALLKAGWAERGTMMRGRPRTGRVAAAQSRAVFMARMMY